MIFKVLLTHCRVCHFNGNAAIMCHDNMQMRMLFILWPGEQVLAEVYSLK